MEKKALSKKVLASLLTMSCVYLGGSGIAIIAAAPIHDTSTVTNTNKVYEAGSTIIVNGTAVEAAGTGNTTDITILDGTLQVEGSAYASAVIAERQGNLIFQGNELVIKNNGDADGWGAGIAAFSGGSVNLKNVNTEVVSNSIGIWSTGAGSNMTVDNDLKITVTGANINYGSHGIMVTQGAAFNVKGNTVIDVTAAADAGTFTSGINIWGDSGLSNSTSFNTTTVNVQGGWSSYGIIERGDANILNFADDTRIEVKDGEFQNVGINISGDGTVAEFGDLHVIASGGTSDIDGSAAMGITVVDSTVGFNGITEITAKENASSNNGMLVTDSKITMGKTVITATDGELAIGMQLDNSKAEITDDLSVNVSNASNNNVGINIIRDGELKGKNINVAINGTNTGAFTFSENSRAQLDGKLMINAQGGDDSRGLAAMGSSLFEGATAEIVASGDMGIAILAINSGKIVFNDDVATDAKQAVYVNGIDNADAASVKLAKGFISTHADSQLIAYNGGIIDINAAGQGIVKFQGTTEVDHDLNNPVDGIININLNTQDSYWRLTGDSSLTDLKMNNASVDMRSDNNTYSTLTTVNLGGSNGSFKQDIDVRSMESDKLLVTGDFSGTQALDIYQKDNYVPVDGSTEGTGLVLASVNGSGVFTAKDREGTLFYNHYDLANKASGTAGFTTDWYLDKIIKTDQPTTSVETVLSANALNYHTWRTENDKLLQRMGELRHNGEEDQGAWFRVKGSKIGRSGKFGFENKYTAYELGYDELTKNTADVKRYQGAALSYADGSSSYSSGSGDNSSKAISFYNTEIGSKGHYLDVVFKISNMANDFTVYDTNSNRITGDFNNTGVALSAEYGRKNALNNGWYIEPQAQFTLGYLGGDSYTASNGIEVSQSGIKSAVGRIGFNIGKEVGSKGIVYAKANLLHEFGGGYDVSMRDSSGAVTVSDSFNDTWFEYGIGAAVAMGTNSQLYVDVERSSGSDFKKDWTWNAGARWTF